MNFGQLYWKKLMLSKLISRDKKIEWLDCAFAHISPGFEPGWPISKTGIQTAILRRKRTAMICQPLNLCMHFLIIKVVGIDIVQ
jgi:hypothetical protein